MFRMPLLFAILAWLAYAAFAGIAASMAADLHPVRETRVSCSLTPGEAVPGVGRSWATCQLGKGNPIITNTYDLTRPHRAMTRGATYSLRAAMFFTVGTLAVAVFSLFGGARVRRARKRHLANAVDHVQRGHARARRDVASTKARLGKVGERRAKRWGKRWSAEAAAGETYSNPGLVDRWLLRQTKPPKTRTAKKADRAAKKIGKADERRRDTEADTEWEREIAAIEARKTAPMVSTAKTIRAGKKVGDAMRVDAGGPKDQIDAWRQVIENPHENGPLPPPPPFVAAPSPNTPDRESTMSRPTMAHRNGTETGRLLAGVLTDQDHALSKPHDADSHGYAYGGTPSQCGCAWHVRDQELKRQRSAS